ncbi:hypothetical protein MTR_7g101810 [Medicago truncatula]|uniref:Uncharacterized protein n=1 Tax=Medicago truncatula TaxID=3880 RepID=G7L3V0_MEDTR|nr:hypothetical protein MTR_7g101810 [Medicago truncatula]
MVLLSALFLEIWDGGTQDRARGFQTLFDATQRKSLLESREQAANGRKMFKTSVTRTSEDRKPAAYQIMLATSHRQRAKIRRNGDHRSPRRLKKKGSYFEKTYKKIM